MNRQVHWIASLVRKLCHFKKLNEEGVTIVMITHDRAIADQAQRKIEILDGEIVYHPERGGVDR